MKILFGVVLLLAVGSACSKVPQASTRDAEAFASFWSTGAEITSYALSQNRYGESHEGHAELIFVTEPFLPDAQVKRDFGSGPAVPALKLNALRTFNTGLYSYRTMQSTFAPLDRERFPHALKSTLSVQDWCGQVFQQINLRDDGWRQQLYSYFQSTGDASSTLPLAWLEDELWLLIRRDPSALPTGELEIVPALLHSRFAHQPLKAEAARTRLEQDGSEFVYEIQYLSFTRSLTIRFNAEFPHFIQGWTETTEQGTTKARRQGGLGQSEYWRWNKPKNGKLREKLGLEAVAD